MYGVLSLASDINTDTFPIGYNAPVPQVYSHVAKTFTRLYQDLSFMRMKPYIAPRPHALPSWVPDWSCITKGYETLGSHGGKTAVMAQTDSTTRTGSSQSFTDVDSAPSLTVRGVLVGRIVSLSSPNTNSWEHDELDPAVMGEGEWHQMVCDCCSPSDKYRFTGEHSKVAFYTTLLQDRLLRDFNYCLRRTRTPTISQMLDTSTGEHETADGRSLARPIADAVHVNTKSRNMAVMDSGHLCNVPRDCLINDHVWLLMGCDRPCVICRLSIGAYEFKNVCYVHGIMDGEHLLTTYKPSDSEGKDMDDAAWLDSLSEYILFETEKLTLI